MELMILPKLRRMKLLLILFFIFFIPGPAFSGENEQNSGILFGTNHVFLLRAPPGWRLDNTSGIKQGLNVVFYPMGQSWSKTDVIAYAHAATKNKTIKDITSLVQHRIETFRKKGSPCSNAKFVKKKKTSNGKRIVHIYFFEGNAWGNYEAAGYIEEKKTINYIVISARTQNVFKHALDAFEQLISSYVFVTDNVTIKESQLVE